VPLTFPTFSAGQRVPASYLQALSDDVAGLVPAVMKTADQTVTNNSTLQDDAELLLPVVANATYEMNALVIYSGTTAGDCKIAWTAPAGSALDWVSGGLDPAVGAAAVVGSRNFEIRALTDFAQSGGTGAGNKLAIVPSGTLYTGGSAGTFRMQFAQFVAAAATSAVVYARSKLSLRRIA
jgi:hypothetical protein